MKFLIVTGLSGSGKSGVVNVLEDIGYYCVDNIPPKLIPELSELCMSSKHISQNVAFVVDIRGGELFFEFSQSLDYFADNNLDLSILFLDSSDDVIIRRYKETRRKHPLDEISNGSIIDAIKTERELLAIALKKADYYIDTSELSVAQLKEKVHATFLTNPSDGMEIKIMSFGFKYGSTKEADLIFDVRCLPNPFYIKELREHTGLETCVNDYVMQFKQSTELFDKLKDLLDFLIPLYTSEGKSQLVVAFGCTGGKHRSVTFAEYTYKYLLESDKKCRISHRDILR